MLGKVFTAEQAVEARSVHRVSPPESFIENALKMAREILPKGGFKREYLRMMKEGVLGEVAEELAPPRQGGSDKDNNIASKM